MRTKVAGAARRITPQSNAYRFQERAVLVLTAREAQAFVDAILKPAEPGPVLRAAARDYKRRIRQTVGG